MYLSLSWLADYLDPVPEASVLVDRLTMSGLEAEVARRPAEGLADSLVVVRIEEVAKHPNADRLSVCSVDDGAEKQEIVCGADNMAAGDLAVLVRPGGRLPGGGKIKRSRIRGVESAGMLCSEAELGISPESAGIIILGSGSPGEPAVARLGLDETIIETVVTPNRGDCLSVRGLAREAAAVCGAGLTAKFAEKSMRPTGACEFTVAIDETAGCSMYRGLLVGGVSPGPSPAWLTTRLASAGLRPVNNLVDVTNLLLLELGQPLHAFDADLIEGGRIRVGMLDGPEKFKALDGQDYELTTGDMVIADAAGPVALAGIMGGQRAAVSAATKRVFLESAYFEPVTVRRTSRRLGVVSDSSYRFERGVDSAMVEEALLRAGSLLTELAGGEVDGGIAEAGKGPTNPERIVLRKERLGAVLAEEVELEEACRILSALGVGVESDDDSVRIDVPGHRHDLRLEIDIIEEVARVRGYDRVPAELPRVVMGVAGLPAGLGLVRRIRQRSAAIGLTEIVGMAFASPSANRSFPGLHDPKRPSVRIVNPIRAGEEEMRRSLLPGLLEAQAMNLRNGSRVVDLFTCGQTYCGPGRGTELACVAGLFYGPRRGRGPGEASQAHFWDAKGAVEIIVAAAGAGGELGWEPCTNRPDLHPKASASVTIAGRVLGHAGRIHPDAAREAAVPAETTLFELDRGTLLDRASGRVTARPLARFPAVVRDLSLIVGEDTLAGQVYAAVVEFGEKLVEGVLCFDEYSGEGVEEGSKALAFSITYRAADRTLTDDEVAGTHQRLVSHITDTLGVRARA